MKGIWKFSPVLALPALALSSTVSAGDAGYGAPQEAFAAQQQFIVRAGGYYISAGDDEVSFVDDAFGDLDAFRATVDPGSEWGWYFNFEWKPSQHWGLELGYMVGDNHTSSHADGFFSQDLVDVDYRDVVSFSADISTASLKFYPLDETCLFQPYIGAGISYTDFGGNGLSREVRTDLAEIGRRGDAGMVDSWGYTWQAGLDFNFGHDSAWLVNFAALYARADTDIRVRISDDISPPPDVDPVLESFSGDYIYDPWMLNLSVGYKFSF